MLVYPAPYFVPNTVVVADRPAASPDWNSRGEIRPIVSSIGLCGPAAMAAMPFTCMQPTAYMFSREASCGYVESPSNLYSCGGGDATRGDVCDQRIEGFFPNRHVSIEGPLRTDFVPTPLPDDGSTLDELHRQNISRQTATTSIVPGQVNAPGNFAQLGHACVGLEGHAARDLSYSLGNARFCPGDIVASEEFDDGLDEHRSSASTVAGSVLSLGAAIELDTNAERCTEIIAQIDAGTLAMQSLVRWLLPVAKELALSKNGCRIIQKAIQSSSTNDLTLLVNELKGSTEELYKSPSGNHVISQIIEVMAPAQLGFLIHELSGKALILARHQYGCRVLERLIEHFPFPQISGLIDEILVEAEPLCRHPFGNFVMQHFLELGPEECKTAIAKKVVGVFPVHAKHRAASHVVQKALKFCNEDIQRELVESLVNAVGEFSLVALAGNRYGSFVVHELASMPFCYNQVRQILQEGLALIVGTKYGKRALAPFGLLQSCEIEAVTDKI